MPSVLALLLGKFSCCNNFLPGTLVKSAEDQPGSAARSQKSRVKLNARSTNGTTRKSQHLLNPFVFIIDIDLPVAIMHLWTFFCKHSAGGSFY